MISQHCFARFFFGRNIASLVACCFASLVCYRGGGFGYRLFFLLRLGFFGFYLFLCRRIQMIYIMALEIRTIPTLRGKEAKRFVKLAEDAEKKPKSQDFSKQIEITQKILKEAGML